MTRTGRPRKRATGIYSCYKDFDNDITFFLTWVMSMLYCIHSMFENTIREAMHSKLRHEVSKMQQAQERLRDLAPVYHEFIELQKEAVERKRHIETLVALVGSVNFNVKPGNDTTKKQLEKLELVDVDAYRSRLPLWEAMREYLTYIPEARIGEMEEFFQKEIGFAEGNRQAMESALKRHPKVFKTRKQKREKYISLK